LGERPVGDPLEFGVASGLLEMLLAPFLDQRFEGRDSLGGDLLGGGVNPAAAWKLVDI
jgi:hypothetical protein